MTPKEDRPRGLGRGLSALIGDEAVMMRGGEPSKATRTLPVAFLKPGKYQPRKNFADDALAELAASIKEKGVLTPILVRPLGADAYEIVAGERRRWPSFTTCRWWCANWRMLRRWKSPSSRMSSAPISIPSRKRRPIRN